VRLRRSPLLFWTAAGAAALATVATVSGLAGRAADRAAALGGLVEVAVAARPVAAGATLAAADVAARRLPAALLPDAPRPASAAAATGRVARVDLAAGEVLLTARLAPDGVEGVAALLPPGRSAVAVPADAARLALRPADRVDVLATFDALEAGAEPTVVVAAGAVVLAAGEDDVTLAVTPAQAPRLAFAMARAVLTLALTSDQPRSERARFPAGSASSSAPAAPAEVGP